MVLPDRRHVEPLRKLLSTVRLYIQAGLVSQQEGLYNFYM